jgi:hypothetical protein
MRFAESIGGDIARLGEERIVICPANVKIWRENEYCQSAACEHVKFALDLPEVQEIMRRKSLEKASREVEGSSRSA